MTRVASAFFKEHSDVSFAARGCTLLVIAGLLRYLIRPAGEQALIKDPGSLQIQLHLADKELHLKR